MLAASPETDFVLPEAMLPRSAGRLGCCILATCCSVHSCPLGTAPEFRTRGNRY